MSRQLSLLSQKDVSAMEAEASNRTGYYPSHHTRERVSAASSDPVGDDSYWSSLLEEADEEWSNDDAIFPSPNFG